jgi:ubiquinone/menaquinone biosynthesis C-methylase UbiE
MELGEIEAALENHEDVQDALVIAREDELGQNRLIGYVIRRNKDQDDEQARAFHVRVWQQLYDSTYRRKGQQSGDFDTISWNSSYTGEPIPTEEMRIWVDETVARISAFAPRRVLEIGCGTGLLLTRLAGACDSYIGLDFSAEALKRLQAYLSTRSDLSRVVLRQGLANDLGFLKDASVDFVILNSVVQYFPDVDYLLAVLGEVSRVTLYGGHIFVGDVRSLALLEAFHASVQLHKASGHETIEELRDRIRLGMRNERELILHPEFFEKLRRHIGRVGRVEILPKTGAYDNEISRFRYDVVMNIGEKMQVTDAAQWLTWDAQGRWKDQLKEMFAVGSTKSVGVRGIPDKRAADATAVVRMLHSTAPEAKHARDLLTAVTRPEGEAHEEVKRIAGNLGVGICFRHFAANGSYDAIYNPNLREAPVEGELSADDLRRYAHAPCRSFGEADTDNGLQRFLRERLPEDMVPSKLVYVKAWPLTANGKLDRGALPLPLED